MDNESKKQKLHLGQLYHKPIFTLGEDELELHHAEMYSAATKDSGTERGDLGGQRLTQVLKELGKHKNKNSNMQHFRLEYVQGQKAYAELLKRVGSLGIGAAGEHGLELAQAYAECTLEFNDGANSMLHPTTSRSYLRLQGLLRAVMKELSKTSRERADFEAFHGQGCGELYDEIQKAKREKEKAAT